MSNEEIKEFIYNIMETESRRWDIPVKVFPVTVVEYNKSDTFKKKLSLISKAKNLFYSISSIGINLDGERIVIFIDKFKRYKKVSAKIKELAFTCFHEFRHSMQDYYESDTYAGFLLSLEFITLKLNYAYDIKIHDEQYFEIDADLYAIQNTIELLKDNYPDIYIKEKDSLERKEEIFVLRRSLYSPLNKLEQCIKRIRNMNMPGSEFKYVSNTTDYMFNDILSVFLNLDGKYKSLNEILSNPNFDNIDLSIVYLFFSTKYFIQSVNYEELTIDQIDMLREALTYFLDYYEEQKTMFDRRIELELEYANKKNSLGLKILGNIRKAHYELEKKFDLNYELNLIDDRIKIIEKGLNSLNEVAVKKH